jgi:DNA recombination protein RmuC
MENTLLLVGVGFLMEIGILYFAYRLFKRFLEPAAAQNGEKDSASMLLLQSQVNELAKALDMKLGETNREMQSAVRMQFGESQKLMREINEIVNRNMVNVTEKITQANASTQQMLSIADQLQNLEKVLKNQKQRGNLGEAGLELIMSNVLPPTAYKLQYEFKNGEKVDAAIMTKDGIIPVDAKFSLDNYNRIVNEKDDAAREALEKEFKNDLKKRIDETAKYIRPEEGTLPFAFMFIPAEGIYYDLLINEVGAVKVNTRNLIDYAYKDKKVIIVSPTTFSAYLQSVLFGFRAFKIEESAKDIIKNVEVLSKHLLAYDDYFRKVGNNLATTVNSYNFACKELKKIDKDVLKISGQGTGIEVMQLEKPNGHAEE